MSANLSISIGQRFTRLVVIARAGKNRYGYLYECLCDCGGHAVVSGSALRFSKKKSCGCLHVKHGMTSTPEFSAWTDMQRRCYDPRNSSYKYYGARGIRVFEAWRGEDGFLMFLEHVGRRPGSGYSLDRYPDKDGDYRPNNVRWATIEEQNQNKTDNVWVTFNGKTRLLQQWAVITGMKVDTLYCRKRNGWSDEDIIRVPLRQSRKKFYNRLSAL